ncbi:MAG: tetratricopeptide repeat protein [Myxococcota bacterium]
MRVILGVISLFFINGCAALDARVEANQAYQAFNKKDYAGAIEHYGIALQNSPDNRSLQKNLGLSHLELAKTAENPTDATTHYNQAIDALFKVLKQTPEDKELGAVLVEAWTQTDRLQEASTYYQEYVKKFPKDPEGWQILGQIEVHRGNYQAALDTYEKRQQLEPEDLQITSGKAILCWEWLRASEAEDSSKAIEIANIGLDAAMKTDAKDPKHPTALVYAGLLLRQRAARQKDSKASQNDLLEAKKLLERVRARNKGA